MSRCLLGPKKLRKISAIVSPRFEVDSATVRGGNPHYWATTFLIERQTGAKIIAYVNYKTGEIELTEPLRAWTHSQDHRKISI